MIGIKFNGLLEFISFMDFQEDIFGILSQNRRKWVHGKLENVQQNIYLDDRSSFYSNNWQQQQKKVIRF